MQIIGKSAIFALLLCLLVPVAWGQVLTVPDPSSGPDPPWEAIDVAIALDVSDSMKTLIDATRLSLWDIVHDLTLLKPTPTLRVALLTYGHATGDPNSGWVRLETDLTQDLDVVSERLFALTSKGSVEYVGRVLQFADQLDWHPGDNALKLVVLAGNESAHQDDEVPLSEVCSTLVTRGIMVNSIYCGPAGDEIAPGWQEVARLADGQFASIDHNHGTLIVETPFDARLSELSVAVTSRPWAVNRTWERGACPSEWQTGLSARISTIISCWDSRPSRRAVTVGRRGGALSSLTKAPSGRPRRGRRTSSPVHCGCGEPGHWRLTARHGR